MMPGPHIPGMKDKLDLLQQTIHAIGKEQAILKLSKQFPQEELSFLADQINGRELARDKFPFLAGREDIIYPPSFYLEQTSSEKTARFKASLVDGESLIDMTGGFGIDAYFFSQRINNTWYIEQDPAIYAIASANLQLLNPSIKTLHADSLQFLQGFDNRVDWIYLDPIRRKTDRRLKKIEEFSPNIHEIQQMLFEHAHHVMVKLSPMTDITQAIRIFSNKVSKAYVVAVDNECKELLIVSDGDVHTDPVVESINFVKDAEERFISSHTEAPARLSLSDPLAYLYEPNAAVFKAQQYDELALKHSLFKLHRNTHLYTSNELHAGYAGKIYTIKGVHAFDLKSFSKESGGASFNIKTRNFPLNPSQVAKKLRIKEGGDEYLFCVKTKDEKLRLLVCSIILKK